MDLLGAGWGWRRDCLGREMGVWEGAGGREEAESITAGEEQAASSGGFGLQMTGFKLDALRVLWN